MKKLHIYLVLAVAFFFIGSVSANAQGKYGKDSAQCVNYLNFYKDYLKQGNIKNAAPLWRGAFTTCPPKASHNMFIDGRKIYQQLIRLNASNPELVKGLVDTLMLIHQVRGENYPKYKAAVAENKAYDMLSYFGDNQPEKVFEAIEDVLKISGNKTKPALLVAYMTKAAELYQANKMSDDQVLKAYTELSPILEAAVAVKPAATDAKAMKSYEDAKGAQQAFENAFVTSGVATCDNLLLVFTPRFEANPTDMDVIKPIVKLLGADTACVQSDLFLKSVNAMHEIEPSYNSAYYLYKLHGSKNNYDEAMSFLQQAIDSEESDAVKDAELLFEMAVFSFKNGKDATAVAKAKEAAEKDASWAGKSYLLMADIWAGQKCTAQDMDNRAKYWVAVDYLQKAKNADETLADEVNGKIATYRQYFPKTEDAFMYDLTDGKSYSISCGGMYATTTVRTIK